METQVSTVAKSAFCHHWLIGQLIPYLSLNLAMVIHAIVTFRLDYCNFYYSGLRLTLTWKLQLVQNALACLLTGIPLWVYIHHLTSN